MRSVRSVLVALLVVFGMVCILASGGGGGGGDDDGGFEQTPPGAESCDDISGEWYIVDGISSNCGDTIYRSYHNIEQDECSIVIRWQGIVLNANIDGNKVLWSSTYPNPDSGGTISSNIDATFNGDTVEWDRTFTASDGCSGTSHATGERVD